MPDVAPWRQYSPSYPDEAKRLKTNNLESGPSACVSARIEGCFYALSICNRISLRDMQHKYCGYDKAPVQWTGASCRDDRI